MKSSKSITPPPPPTAAISDDPAQKFEWRKLSKKLIEAGRWDDGKVAALEAYVFAIVMKRRTQSIAGKKVADDGVPNPMMGEWRRWAKEVDRLSAIIWAPVKKPKPQKNDDTLPGKEKRKNLKGLR